MSHRCVAQHLPGRHLPEDLFAFSHRESALLLAQSLTIARAWGDGVVITPDDVLLLIATCHKLYHGAPSLSQLVEFMAAAKSTDHGSDASSSGGRQRASAGKRATPGLPGPPAVTPLGAAVLAGATAAAEDPAQAAAVAALATATAVALAAALPDSAGTPGQGGRAAETPGDHAAAGPGAGIHAAIGAPLGPAAVAAAAAAAPQPLPRPIDGHVAVDAPVAKGTAGAVSAARDGIQGPQTEKPRAVQQRVLPRVPGVATRGSAANHAGLEPPRTPNGGRRAAVAAAASPPEFSGSPQRVGRIGRIDSDRPGQRPPSKRAHVGAAAADPGDTQPLTAAGTGTGEACTAAVTSPYRTLRLVDDET